jgi:hypothetical protein
MKRLFTICVLLLFIAGCASTRDAKGACRGKIASVFLVEKEDFGDMDAMVAWVQKCKVDNGILILYNIGANNWRDSSSYLRQMRSMNIRVIVYNTPGHAPSALANEADRDKSGQSKAAFRNQTIRFNPDLILSAGDYAAGSTIGQNSNILYLTEDDKDDVLDLRGLIQRPDFLTVVKELKFDSVVYRKGLIEGGDMMWVDSCLIVGQQTLYRFSPAGDQQQAENAIRTLYGFDKHIRIEFFIAGNADLYHIFLTYAGKNLAGKDQFFMGYVGNSKFETDAERCAQIKADLKTLYPRFEALLGRSFPGHYELDSVPMYLNVYLLSPLNGIADCIDGNPVYYFPYPAKISGISGPEVSTMLSLEDKAYAIMNKRINTIKLYVPIEYMSYGSSGGGQSLHCSVGIIRRRGPRE